MYWAALYWKWSLGLVEAKQEVHKHALPAGNECDRATAERSNRACRPSDVDSSVLSGEGREKCVSCIFTLRSHGGEVGRRVTELFFDGGAAMVVWWCSWWCGGGGSEEEGVGRR